MTSSGSEPSEDSSTSGGQHRWANKALNGVWLGSVLALVNRASSFVSQLVAGWLLLPDDYGIVAMATGLAAISNIISGAGITRFLVQRHADFAQLALPSYWFSLCCNCLAAIIYLAVGGIMTLRGESPLLLPVMVCMGFSLLLRTSAAVRRADMQARLDFRGIFEIDRYTLFLQHGLTIFFAFIGLGPLALVLPNVACALYENQAFRRRVGTLPQQEINRESLSHVFRSVRWIMLGAACMAISQQGDYFIVGVQFPKHLAGAYYFGFVAAASFSRVFTSALGGAMTALLARHQDNPAELRRLTVRTQTELGLLLSILSLGIALATPAVFHFLWQGRYDNAILPTLAVLIALPIRSISPIHESLIEATGRWKLRAGVFAADAVGSLLSAAIGVSFGDMLSLCLAVLIYRLSWGVFLLAHSGVLLKMGFTEIPRRVVPTFFLFAGLALSSWTFATYSAGDSLSLVSGALAVLAYLLMSSVVLLLLFRERTRWLLQRILASRKAS